MLIREVAGNFKKVGLKDGNHKNNCPDNLQTICANCHRLKTVISGDHNGVAYVPTELDTNWKNA